MADDQRHGHIFGVLFIKRAGEEANFVAVLLFAIQGRKVAAT
jgi:hypothetical protein